MLANEGMTKGDEFGPAEEYNSLREELLQAKKYVFERPLLIVAAAAAGSQGAREGVSGPASCFGRCSFAVQFLVHGQSSFQRSPDSCLHTT